MNNDKQEHWIICDNCTEDYRYGRDFHRCRADPDSCIDGTDCVDYVNFCGCLICWPIDGEWKAVIAPKDDSFVKELQSIIAEQKEQIERLTIENNLLRSASEKQRMLNGQLSQETRDLIRLTEMNNG